MLGGMQLGQKRDRYGGIKARPPSHFASPWPLPPHMWQCFSFPEGDIRARGEDGEADPSSESRLFRSPRTCSRLANDSDPSQSNNSNLPCEISYSYASQAAAFFSLFSHVATAGDCRLPPPNTGWPRKTGRGSQTSTRTRPTGQRTSRCWRGSPRSSRVSAIHFKSNGPSIPSR